MAEYLLALVQRREDLERGVFSHPPSDWEEYQRRLGRYQELTHLIGEIQGDSDEKDEL